MKKIITLCLFVFAIAFGSQETYAQDKAFEDKAFLKSQELKRTIKFNDVQQEEVAKVLTKYYKYLSRPAENNPELVAQRKAKITKFVDERLKSILTEQQFALFKKEKLE